MSKIDALAPHLLGVRQHMQDLKQSRRERSALENELATYRTPSELEELGDILSRHADHDSAEIREILNRNRAA